MAWAGDGRLASVGRDGTVRVWLGNKEAQRLTSVGSEHAAWRPADQHLPHATAAAWRWLQVLVRDEDGRLLGMEPYEWHYATAGGPLGSGTG